MPLACVLLLSTFNYKREEASEMQMKCHQPGQAGPIDDI